MVKKSSDRQEQISRIYSAALEVEEKEQTSFIKQACGDDAELCHEVESLLSLRAQGELPLEGETLCDRLKSGPLPLDELLRTAIEIAHALDQAHRKGDVHGDLNPDNILLSKGGAGAPRTLIQGGTRAPSTTPSLSPLARGTLGGESKRLTPQYLAPEQIEGKEVDARTDIFSLGVVIYEMATGRKPFEGESNASLAKAILTAEPPPMKTVQPQTPPALERVVKTCLAKDPDERWQTARDLVRELKWIADAHVQPLPSKEELRRKKRERRIWTLVSVLLLALGVISGTLYFHRPSVQTGLQRFVLPPGNTDLTSRALAGSSFFGLGISPDGRQLVIANRDSLWLRPFNSVNAQRLSGTENAFSFCWSQDSRFIIFFKGRQILRVSPNEGVPKLICEFPKFVLSGACNREEIILFWSGNGIWKVSAKGGSPSPVIELDRQNKEIAAWPWFLPDGRHFVYVLYRSQYSGLRTEGIVPKEDTLAGEATSRDGKSGIYVGSLDSKETKPLLDLETQVVYAWPGYLLYQREGRLLAHPFDAQRLSFTGDPSPIAEGLHFNNFGDRFFTVSDGGTLLYLGSGSAKSRQLMRTDRNGRQTEIIGPPGKYYRSIELSPDGKQIALEQSREGTDAADIWTMNLLDGRRTQITSSAKAWNYVPRWSPDGKKIIFSSNRDALDHGESHGNLYITKIANGLGSETPLLKNSQWKWANDWSPDGRYFLYWSYSNGSNPVTSSLWLLPLLGVPKPVSFLESADDGRFSPNGRWIAYQSIGPSDKIDINVRAFPLSEKKWKLSMRDAFNPRWRKDGKELFFIEPVKDTENTLKLMSVDVKEGTEPGTIFQASPPRTLFERQFSGDYAASPDGQSFYLFTQVLQNPQVQVVLNWTELLPKK